MVKPKIFPKPKIGRDKFKAILDKTKYINEKEVAFLKISGKFFENISFKRTGYGVSIRNKYLTDILRFFFSLKKQNKSQIIHTHIHFVKNKERLVALPSIGDISHIISQYPMTRHKYDIIAVRDNQGKIRGYTTLILDDAIIKKISKQFTKYSGYERRLLMVQNYIENSLHTIKAPAEELKIYQKLKDYGINIFFTPEEGYRLDKNFNFVKK
jgi:hypothetical protein